MTFRYSQPGEILEWRLCIMLGGEMTVPADSASDTGEPSGLTRHVGSTEWLYRDGFQGTEEEARIETLAWLARTAREAAYIGPQTYEFFPWTADDEHTAKDVD